ncbi:hypothetical protein AVEN_11882-1 [Araneus ventricosus]|uniref:Uncharacterized protein n=1 Tax=Araneus ventricosus TaxID=182803 RepID=A0A4Y2TC45_ARAVE|nr:hypothetical protein AVEN_11882-1 [Araneus ventricosus]
MVWPVVGADGLSQSLGFPGFEPTRGIPNGFRVHRLNHSATTARSQPFSMKWPSGVPWCMTTTWSTTYIVEKCDVMWKLPHPVLTGGSERQLRKITFGIDLPNYNVG